MSEKTVTFKITLQDGITAEVSGSLNISEVLSASRSPIEIKQRLDLASAELTHESSAQAPRRSVTVDVALDCVSQYATYSGVRLKVKTAGETMDDLFSRLCSRQKALICSKKIDTSMCTKDKDHPNFLYRHHALDRMAERGISQSQVEDVLRSGPGTVQSDGVLINSHRGVVVISSPIPGNFPGKVVITVYHHEEETDEAILWRRAAPKTMFYPKPVEAGTSPKLVPLVERSRHKNIKIRVGAIQEAEKRLMDRINDDTTVRGPRDKVLEYKQQLWSIVERGYEDESGDVARRSRRADITVQRWAETNDSELFHLLCPSAAVSSEEVISSDDDVEAEVCAAEGSEC